MVTKRGIEVNTEKVRAIMERSPCTSVKDIQILTGRMVGLSGFISRSAEKGFPFIKILRKRTRLSWMEEAQETFDELNKFLVNLHY